MIKIDNKTNTQRFSRGLGYSLLGAAMEEAPYDTGNLASAIQMPIMTDEHIQIKYSERDAHYLFWVEFGSEPMTPAKQENVGFIRFRTVEQFIHILTNYFENDNVPADGNFSWSATFFDLTQRKGYSQFQAPERLDHFGVDAHKYYVGASRYGFGKFGDTRENRRARSRFYYSKEQGQGTTATKQIRTGGE